MPGPPRPAGGIRIDLHAHTTFSDGDLTPEALVRRAVERGLGALSITDHDSVEAFAPARATAGDDLELVPGIEISTSQNGLDLHILGYYLDPESPELAQRLLRFREERYERMRSIVDRLHGLGIAVDVEEVIAVAGRGVVGRPHLAQVLIRAGHAENADDAFRRLLGARGLAFVPRPGSARSRTRGRDWWTRWSRGSPRAGSTASRCGIRSTTRSRSAAIRRWPTASA